MSDCKPKVILHLAGAIGSAPQAIPALYRSNVRATSVLLEAAHAEVPNATIVLASSSAVYGRTPNPVVSESTPLCPTSAYGLSKAAAEEIGGIYRDRGTDVRIVRIFNVIGMGMPPGLVLSDAAAQMAAGVPLRLGDLRARRDFSDVRDVANILCRLCREMPRFDIVNCGSGVSTSVAECVAALGVLAGAESPEIDPDKIRPEDVQDQVADCMRLRSLLPGWQAEWSIQQSLAAVLDDWQMRVHQMGGL